MHSSSIGGRRARRLVGLLAVSACAIAGAAAVQQDASAASARHVLPGSMPQWLGHANEVGAPAAKSSVSFSVLLSMRHSANAVAELSKLSTPGSRSYGKWLSNARFDAEYAPAPARVNSVRTWLRGQGFAVTKTLPSGMLVEAVGSAAQVEKTFGTQLHTYKFEGKTVRANTSALSLPAGTPGAVVSSVAGVIGVDQGATLKKPADTLPGPPAGARYGVQPCSRYFGQKIATDDPPAYGKKQPYAVCGYVPQQYQGAYGERHLLNSGINGKGVTVAITDAYASPTILQDAQRYSQVHNQPLLAKNQFRQITPAPNGYDLINECGGNGWYGEETLDVEAVHAMAPGAKIVYVGAKDCSTGLDDAWASTIDNHVADVITNSWTDGVDDLADLGQAYVNFYRQFALEAALTGITVNFSSGDSGDHTDGGTNPSAKTAEFPADVPYVTGVGGTSVEIGNDGQWLNEYGWQTDYSQLGYGAWTPAPPGTYSSGGGGGTSQLFAQPFYQKKVVPTSESEYYGSKPMRVVPDVAMPADPNTGFEVGETQVFPNGTYWAQYRIGGTSLASPMFAGVVAVASQDAGHALGFVNPLLYSELDSPALHDIIAPTSPVAQVRTNYVNGVDDSQGKSYELQTIDVQSSTLHDIPGYDDETGVGTPDGPAFFAAAKSATTR